MTESPPGTGGDMLEGGGSWHLQAPPVCHRPISPTEFPVLSPFVIRADFLVSHFYH